MQRLKKNYNFLRYNLMQVNIEFELSGKKPLCVSISEEKRLVKITLFFYNVLGR